MISEDVLHDVYIPAFRTKHDVLPGQYTQEWFKATELGEYYLFCAEYCGTDHSLMKGKVVEMEPAAYEEWLKQTDPAQAPAVLGAKLFEQSCAKCHSASGVVENKGPSLVGLYNAEVKLDGGKTAKADDTYLRESILRPNAKVVAGYRTIMPAFEGILAEDELNDLVAYLKSLAGEPAPSTPAEK
jgi:cytochrome c oxidase subunit 2